MPLAMEIGLSPGDIVLDGDPAPHRKEHSSPPPLFDPLLWSASLQGSVVNRYPDFRISIVQIDIRM